MVIKLGIENTDTSVSYSVGYFDEFIWAIADFFSSFSGLLGRYACFLKVSSDEPIEFLVRDLNIVVAKSRSTDIRLVFEFDAIGTSFGCWYRKDLLEYLTEAGLWEFVYRHTRL